MASDTAPPHPLSPDLPRGSAPPRNAGMREIAERANVTKMTVSRALRTPDKVAPGTLRRIEAAIKELGFIPNHLAGSLANRTSRIVPVIVPTLANSIFSDFIDELTVTLDAGGFVPAFGCSNFDAGIEERLLRRYLGWQPSAVVLIGAAQSPVAADLCRRAGFPVFQTWAVPEHPLGYVVGFSNRDAIYQMVRALQGWGYRHIGFGFVDTPGNDRTQQRRLGWEAALREAGTAPVPSRAAGGPMTVEAGAAILRDLVERHPELDAVAFGSDVLAVGAVLECHRRGIDVPGRLAITGCGDMGMSSIVSPALTTITIPGRAMGRICAEMVTRLIDGRYDGPTVVELPTTLIRRESA